MVAPATGAVETPVIGGLVHDWVGAVFIPGATLEKTLAAGQDYNRHKDIYRPEVMDSRTLAHTGNDFRVYLRLLKKKVVTVVRDERVLPPGTGAGYLWRLNSYWRFEERDGGTWVECEAISLTRDVPTGLGWLIEPIIRSLPRESLESTLRETRAALGK